MQGDEEFKHKIEDLSFAKLRQKTIREVKNTLNNDDPPMSCLTPIWPYINFYVAYSFWLVFCGILGGIVLTVMNKEVGFVDGTFLAVSAVTSTGLSTISMMNLSKESFVVLALLILCGGSLLLPLAPLLYRRYIYAKIKASYPKEVKIEDAPVLSEFDIQDRALLVMIRIIITYVLVVMLIGFMIIYASLHSSEEDPELVRRGFSRQANAAFLSVSAFNNAGYTISSESVFHLQDNPIAYLTLALLIVAGNTMAPVFYRLLIIAELFTRHLFGFKNATVELQFILDNPRKVSVNTLPTREVIFLFITSTALNVVQYIFYLGSSMWRESFIEEYGSLTRLAGIGFFQTISTRNAGLQIMDLRTMNQGMLLVYAICMYLSGAPFVTALYASEDSSETTAKTIKTDTKESGPTDTCATTEDETTLGDDENEGKEGDNEGGEDVGEEKKENESDHTNEHRDNTMRESRRGGFLLSAKPKGQLGEEGGVSINTVTSSTTSSSACTDMAMEDIETGNNSIDVSTNNELDNPLPSVLRRKSTIGMYSRESTRLSSRRESRRGSTLGDFAELIRSSLTLEPTKEKIASTLHEKDTHIPDTLVAADTLRRRSSHTVTFDDQQALTVPEGSLDHLRICTDIESQELSNKRTLISQRRSSTGNIKRQQYTLARGNALANGGVVMDDNAQLKIIHSLNFPPPITQIPNNRRSSLVSIVGGGLTQNLTPVSAANTNINTKGPQHRPTISEEQYRALMRHNSVQLLNQRKFEIKNKFIETFIMKHSFFIGVGVFVCAFSEDLLIVRNPAIFNLWYIIFEVVSAYGNVGLSLGVPGKSNSLCGSFGVIGKLAIILIMLLGKHRGLPKEKDAVIDFKYRRLKRGVASLVAQIESEKRLSMRDGTQEKKLDQELIS